MAAVDQVRLLIADLPEDEADRLLTNEQLTELLGMNDDNVRRASADALEIIATSEALISKKISTQDLSTDGAAVATALMARAKQLRTQASEDEGDDFVFEIVDPPCDTRPELTEWPYIPPFYTGY